MSKIGNGSAIAEGIAQAKELRENWMESLERGDVTFTQLVEMSKQESHRALSTIKLIDILAVQPGWNFGTAEEAMIHQGFNVADQVKSIRRSPKEVQRFATLMSLDSERWKERPQMPYGWPFFGKLADVLEVTLGHNKHYTGEMMRVMKYQRGEYDEDSNEGEVDVSESPAEETQPEIENDALAALLRGEQPSDHGNDG